MVNPHDRGHVTRISRARRSGGRGSELSVSACNSDGRRVRHGVLSADGAGARTYG